MVAVNADNLHVYDWAERFILQPRKSAFDVCVKGGCT